MRPTTSTMLQQNNNNNYPCLSMSGSPRDMLHKCPRASLPLPGRLELGLGDLPLIRGLRAWALCSKNRRRAGSLIGGSRAPAAPPAGPSRPADGYLSGEWGGMGYGLPLGLDARQAGIGALVTVATLKTSEGGGKTQTQCLLLRTEKGSCSYSTAKPSSASSSSAVGEWLRGKAVGGGGGRDAPAPPAHAGANRLRERSGRRWRKYGIAAGRERQQRSREDPGPAAQERQEEQDKGGQDRKQLPSPARGGRRARCCHDASPKSCPQCGRRAQRRQSRDQAESPGKGGQLRLKRQRQKNEEEEEKGGLCDIDPHPDAHSRVDGEEPGSEGGEGPRMQASHRQDGLPHGDDDVTVAEGSEVTASSRTAEQDDCVGVRRRVGGSSDHPAANAESPCPPPTSQSSLPAETEQESERNQGPEGPEEADFGLMGEEEPDVRWFQSQEPNTVTEERSRNGEPGLFLTNNKNSQLERTRVLSPPLLCESEGGAVKLDGDFWRRGGSCNRPGVGICGASEEDGLTGGDISHVQSHRESGIRVHNTAASPRSSPAPSLPPLASMATGLPCLEAEEEEKEEVVRSTGAEERKHSRELEEPGEEERGSNVATEEARREEEEKEEEEEEEDEFGVFMQAEGEPAWSEEAGIVGAVPCGSRESVAAGEQTSPSRPGWTSGSLQQSGDAWTAFPQDASRAGGDAEQWWPTSAAESRADGLLANHTLASVFAEAFPSLHDSSSSDSCDLDAVPTLTQLLRGRASQDQGLLDSFHDLNKMIGQRYKKANGVSRGLLLRTLHLQQPHADSRPASWTSNRRLSPGLPSANQHAQSAAAKRRLSYDYNRNIME